ncbi:MAG: cysteine hydrolase [Anaerolineae bacterium]|nr:cysteine hydrolase [Anaerolineae bacterium]
MDTYKPFLTWLGNWVSGLQPVPFAEAIPNPERTAMLCVDLSVGFAYEGVLSSPRVAGIVPPIVQLFQRAHSAGIKHFVLPQDCHDDDTPEFGSFAPHCQCGSREAETVPELLALGFSEQFEVIHKNSINSAINTTLDAWLNAHHQEIDTFIVVGDCTDLCTHQLAMYLRLRANAYGYKQRVIVPSDCTQTYDLPVDIAENLGIMPHDGDLMHAIFLYQMALNGIEVVGSIVA